MKSHVVIAVFFISIIWAGDTGKIVGRVIDKETRAFLPGANVVIDGTTLGAASGTDGYFSIIVPPGYHLVKCSYIGYRMLTIDQVLVKADLTTELNIELESTAVDQGDSFKRQFPNSIIKWDTLTGNPRSINQFATRAYSGTPETRAKSFLAEHSALLRIKEDLSDLRHIKSTKTAVKGKTGIDYIYFQQFHDNLPIKGAETIVHITETGKVFRINNRYYSEINIVNRKILNEDEAIALARKQITRETKLPPRIKAEPIICPINGVFYYVWRVHISGWRYYFDAESGNVLLSESSIIFQQSGSGQVYEINECVTPDLSNGVLPNLDNSGYLQGSLLNVMTASNSRAYSSSYAFNYNDNDPRFDQVEIYYQLEKAQDYFSGLGYNPNVTPIDIYANVPFVGIQSLECNAGVDLDNDVFYFGIPASGGGCTGRVCNSPGQDGDIAFHEYGHYVIDNIAGLNAGELWPGSVHEAVADYFACSYFNNACLAEPWDINCSTCMRNINNDKKFPDDANWDDPHKMGLILGGALWDIREILGQQFTDWVAIEGLKGLPSNANFTDYAQNVMEAGAAYFGDIDNWIETIAMIIALVSMQEKFCDHGIDPGANGCP